MPGEELCDVAYTEAHSVEARRNASPTIEPAPTGKPRFEAVTMPAPDYSSASAAIYFCLLTTLSARRRPGHFRGAAAPALCHQATPVVSTVGRMNYVGHSSAFGDIAY